MEGLEVGDLRRADRREAAMVLTDAFLDDPAWVAIGPPGEPSRRRLLRRFFRVALFEARHWGGPAWAATHDGAIVGVAVTFGAGRNFPSPLASVLEAPLFLLAGDRTAQRATQVGAAMARAHPRGRTSTCGSWQSIPPTSAAASAERSCSGCSRTPRKRTSRCTSRPPVPPTWPTTARSASM